MLISHILSVGLINSSNIQLSRYFLNLLSGGGISGRYYELWIRDDGWVVFNSGVWISNESDFELFDVILASSNSKQTVRHLEGMVGRLRELSTSKHYVGTEWFSFHESVVRSINNISVFAFLTNS